jgi:hypothetical protein
MESFSEVNFGLGLGERTGGCVRNTPLDCTSKDNTTSTTDMFHPRAHVALPRKLNLPRALQVLPLKANPQKLVLEIALAPLIPITIVDALFGMGIASCK